MSLCSGDLGRTGNTTACHFASHPGIEIQLTTWTTRTLTEIKLTGFFKNIFDRDVKRLKMNIAFNVIILKITRILKRGEGEMSLPAAFNWSARS